MNIRILCIVISLSACSESKFTPIDERNDDASVDADVDEGPPDDVPITEEDSGTEDSGSPCTDDDGDGICNEDDACEGHDDTIDTDEDGVADGCDPCPNDNPDDSDDDGICDGDDTCEGHDDTIDTDEDGVADGCDPCPNDPNDDSDDDLICDSEDRCPGHDDSMDDDSDGVPNGCDPCPFDNPDDSDGDGICDMFDDCPGFDDSLDEDGDSIPDDCDPCPLDNPDDSDGDSVCDSDDICPGGDDTVDTDLDGNPDDCDDCPVDNPDDSDGDSVCESDDICPDGDDTVDTDFDGTPDDCDVCPIDNPDDTDGDSVCDADDICPDGDDTVDTDDDGMPDDCDWCPIDNPDDSDDDSVCDSDDICEGHDDATDTDMDSTPDGCDPCPLDNPDDADGDGICDSDPVPVPNGLIIAFTGSEIPEGWLVCDGTEGTPDLRGRFIVGIIDEEPGTIGGSDTHDHEGFTDVTEMETGYASPSSRSCGPPGCWCTNKASNESHNHDMTHDHTLEPDSSLPPFFEVIYLYNNDANSIPAHGVLASSSDRSTLSDTWEVCDGETDCPDLRDRFLKASSDTTTGAVGGSDSHDHGGWSGTETSTGTFHGSYGMTVTSGGPSATDLSHAHSYEHEHSLSNESTLPPYQYTQWVSPIDDATTTVNTIGMWSGSTDDLPMGWVLCDGTDGTPDLSGLFMRGATSDSDIGLIGGDFEHEHLISEDGGGETGTNGGGNGQCTGGGGLMGFHSHSVPAHDHTMAPQPNEPPYYTMAYIMYAPSP